MHGGFLEWGAKTEARESPQVFRELKLRLGKAPRFSGETVHETVSVKR